MEVKESGPMERLSQEIDIFFSMTEEQPYMFCGSNMNIICSDPC